MYPELFHIPIPKFLQGILPATITIHSYGFMILCGAIAIYLYLRWETKKLGINQQRILEMINLIIIAAIVGGKFFFYLEDPVLYFKNPRLLIENFGEGFVFLGSLLFVIPTLIIFFRYHKMPILKMFDLLAVGTCILHAFGRLGCFLAGCCHGLPSDGPFAVVFTDPACAAEPLNTPLHPTQLYSIFMILMILTILLVVKKRKKFDGQLGLIYLGLYSIGRSIIEIFRGDEARGFLIKNYFSYAQFISLIILIVVVILYLRASKSVQKNK